MNNYENLDLRIEKVGQTYRLRAESSVGEATEDFTSPFTEEELREFELFVFGSVLQVERDESTRPQNVKEFGRRLFESVFKGQIHILFNNSLFQARRTAPSAGLRIRLHLTECPELGELPWEFLYDNRALGFLSLSTITPLVRYLHVDHPIEPLTTQTPLRILVVAAAPGDFSKLEIEHEWNTLERGLEHLIRRGRVSLSRLERTSLSSLRAELDARSCHILHFVGHSIFDEDSQSGLLVLEKEGGKSQLVSGEELGMLLGDHTSLRLVVLNSCEGARATDSDPYCGVAQGLLKQGTPAVIAMRTEITDATAVAMADEFYRSLLRGKPVDEALTGVRRAIFSQDVKGVEWGAPQLYMRAPDGVIFQKAKESPGERIGSFMRDFSRAPAVRYTAVITLTLAVLLAGLSYVFPARYASVRENVLNTLFAPSAPSDFRVADTESDGVTLTWRDNSDNETGFRIWRRDDSTSAKRIVGESVADVTTFIDTTVKPQSVYIYTVRAFLTLELIHQDARSDFSATVEVTTPTELEMKTDSEEKNEKLVEKRTDNGHFPVETKESSDTIKDNERKNTVATPSDSGNVTVATGRLRDTVYIDGKLQERVTPYTFKLAAGAHTIRVAFRGAGGIRETTIVVESEADRRLLLTPGD